MRNDKGQGKGREDKRQKRKAKRQGMGRED